MRASEAWAMSCDQKDRFERSPRPVRRASCRSRVNAALGKWRWLGITHSSGRVRLGAQPGAAGLGQAAGLSLGGASRGHPILPAPLGAPLGPEVQPGVSHTSSGRWIQKFLRCPTLK